jgi:hypothetical protein
MGVSIMKVTEMELVISALMIGLAASMMLTVM